MKCRKCGAPLEQNNRICPQCGYDNTLENLLKNADIPKELKHLSVGQIGKHMRLLHFLSKRKYVVLISMLAILLVFLGVQVAQRHHRTEAVHNFHDDLIDTISTNAYGNDACNLTNEGLLVIYGNDAYVSSQDQLYRVSLALDQKSLLLSDTVSYLNVTQDQLYYLSQEQDQSIMTYNLKNHAVTKSNIRALSLMVVGDYVYYLEEGSHRAVYQTKKDFSERKKLTQSECLMFTISGDWLYYSTDQGIYRVPLMGGEVAKIAEGYYPKFVVLNQMIYYLDPVNSDIMRMKIDGSQVIKLVDDPVSSFTLTERYLVYARKDGGIYKQRLDNGQLSQLSTDRAKSLQTSGVWIYYQLSDGSKEGRFVTIDENSDVITPVYAIKDQS